MKRIIPLLMLLMLITASVFSQRTITGKVTAADSKEPLAGVTVIADNTKGGAQTKADGSFSINVSASSTSLSFTSVGFQPQTISIGNSTSITVNMVTAITEGNEVVVIGYGTQKDPV